MPCLHLDIICAVHLDNAALALPGLRAAGPWQHAVIFIQQLSGLSKLLLASQVARHGLVPIRLLFFWLWTQGSLVATGVLSIIWLSVHRTGGVCD